jgi:DNA-binding beta-propeller fold protein YncE
MRRLYLIAIAIAVCGAGISAQQRGSNRQYKILRTEKVGGDGGFDYVYADAAGRRLYIPRSGPNARIDVFDLDTLSPVGSIPKVSARGAAVDPGSHHGFVSSKPVTMFDASSLAILKSIDVQGNPDGILFDPFNERVYIFSHSSPNATVINAKDGTLVGTIDFGGAPEQAVTDGKGHLYVDLEDKDAVAIVDARTMAVTGRYDLAGKGGGPAGLGFDAKNGILFVACHDPQTMVIMDAKDGTLVGTIDLGGAPEQAVTDGKGHLYIDLEDKDAVAVVDARTMAVTGKYDLAGKGGGPAGLGFDAKNGILFVACHDPQTMVIMSAKDGRIITTLPVGAGVDGALFNPATGEAFSSQGDGTLTIVKENSPTSFSVEQTVKTMTRAKTLTLDSKTNHILLIAAQYAPPPSPPPAGGRGGRGLMVPDSFSILEVGK